MDYLVGPGTRRKKKNILKIILFRLKLGEKLQQQKKADKD